VVGRQKLRVLGGGLRSNGNNSAGEFLLTPAWWSAEGLNQFNCRGAKRNSGRGFNLFENSQTHPIMNKKGRADDGENPSKNSGAHLENGI